MKTFQEKFLILVYHHIVPDDFSVDSFPPGDRPYFSRVSDFYSHLDYLTDNNIFTLTVEEIGMPEGKYKTFKKVVITFDDGQISDYTIAFPSLIERKMKATFYITTDYVEKKGYLNWKQIKEMDKYGMEIGSHSCSHPCLLDFDKEAIQIELLKSRQILEDKLGCPIQSFSIPFGFGDKGVIDLILKNGYQTICTSKVKLSRFNAYPPVYGRIGIRRSDVLEKFKGIVEMEWQTIGKLIMEDRMKAAMKCVLGRGLWHRLRAWALSRHNNSDRSE